MSICPKVLRIPWTWDIVTYFSSSCWNWKNTSSIILPLLEQKNKQNWLVVSTHLKNMLVKMGSSSPIFGVKNPKICELPPPRKTLILKCDITLINMFLPNQSCLPSWSKIRESFSISPKVGVFSEMWGWEISASRNIKHPNALPNPQKNKKRSPIASMYVIFIYLHLP